MYACRDSFIECLLFFGGVTENNIGPDLVTEACSLTLQEIGMLLRHEFKISKCSAHFKYFKKTRH